MKGIDNFDKIIPHLSFDSDDDFYFVQIIQRKKDNPNGGYGSNNPARLIKAYYVSSTQKLLQLKDEIIKLCHMFNARAGINMNKRSYEKTAYNTMLKIAQQMHNKDFKAVKTAYNTSCGVHNGGDKIWLLDVDNINRNVNEMILFIERNCQPIGTKFIDIIPSKTGYHVLTHGFDTREFSKQYPDVEIHKNNPTNLYIPLQ